MELLRDGDRLAEHSGRFSQPGSYATDLSFSDYIILDCRTERVRDPHPGGYIYTPTTINDLYRSSHNVGLQKLYHVVFSDDFEKVSILSNALVTVTTFGLLCSA